MSDSDYPDMKNVKKILVAKLRHHGDVLLTTPVYAVLGKAFPQAQIHGYIYEESALLLKEHPHISKIHLYNRGWKKLSLFARLKKEFTLLKSIRKEQYDLVINLTEGDRGALAAWISGAKIKVGIDPGKKGMFGKRKIFTHLSPVCPSPRHAVERNLDVLRRIGLFPEEQQKELYLSVSERDRKTTAELTGEGGYLVLHLVSRWMFKAPSLSFDKTLIELLLKQGERIVLSSGNDRIERERCQELTTAFAGREVLNLSGETNLKTLGALIEGAEALITVDSLPLHIASVFKTPVVAIFGPTSEINWGPWNHPSARVVAKSVFCRPCYRNGCGGSRRSDCLDRLEPESVVEALYNLKSSPRYEERASLLRRSSSTVPESSTFPSLIK